MIQSTTQSSKKQGCYNFSMLFRLERLEYLAETFRRKCASQEEWAKQKEETLKVDDWPGSHLCHLKVTILMFRFSNNETLAIAFI